jgi:fibro-slime domain-containing protein
MKPLGPVSCCALALAAASCGRTELDECVVGTSRPCHGTCGEGQQTCVFGAWTVRCEVPIVRRECSSACGLGAEICSDETWHPCDAPQPKPPTLHATIRDFHDTHPDFERPQLGDHPDPGIVTQDLGPDDKPVYGGNPTTETTSGAMYFDQWYNDVPGVNESTTIDLPLVAVDRTPVLYVYQNLMFFPIDDMLFGNEGRIHNYHFTLESHTRFNYVGGEILTVAGDDDVFVYIDRKLAIDLGGIHVTRIGTVDLDAAAADLGIARGGNYQLDVFFAERHTFGSTFTVATTIVDASSCE